MPFCKCLTYLFGWMPHETTWGCCVWGVMCVFVPKHNMHTVDFFTLHKWWCPLKELIIEMHIYYATFASCYYTFFNIIHMNHVYVCVWMCVCLLTLIFICVVDLVWNNIGENFNWDCEWQTVFQLLLCLSTVSEY